MLWVALEDIGGCRIEIGAKESLRRRLARRTALSRVEGLSTWPRRSILAALGVGVSEEIVETLAAEVGDRSALVTAAKVGNPSAREATAPGYSRIIEAAERSLRRLRTDYIDIYRTHIDLSAF